MHIALAIRRIEGGMLSYHADMDANTNPFELGLDRLVDLDTDAEFIGKSALKRIKRNGVSRRQVGLVLLAAPLAGPNTTFWRVQVAQRNAGYVTSAIYSPRLERNIALAMLATEFTEIGTGAKLKHPRGIAWHR